MQIPAANRLKIGQTVKFVHFGRKFYGEVCGNIDKFPSVVYIDIWSPELGLLRCISTKFVHRVLLKEDLAKINMFKPL